MEDIKASNLEWLGRVFNCLGNARRFEIMKVLVLGDRTVGELAVHLKASNSVVSQHLSQMWSLDMVSRQRDGVKIFYSCGNPVVAELVQVLDGFLTRAEDAKKPLGRVRPRTREWQP